MEKYRACWRQASDMQLTGPRKEVLACRRTKPPAVERGTNQQGAGGGARRYQVERGPIRGGGVQGEGAPLAAPPQVCPQLLNALSGWTQTRIPQGEPRRGPGGGTGAPPAGVRASAGPPLPPRALQLQLQRRRQARPPPCGRVSASARVSMERAAGSGAGAGSLRKGLRRAPGAGGGRTDGQTDTAHRGPGRAPLGPSRAPSQPRQRRGCGEEGAAASARTGQRSGEEGEEQRRRPGGGDAEPRSSGGRPGSGGQRACPSRGRTAWGAHRVGARWRRGRRRWRAGTAAELERWGQERSAGAAPPPAPTPPRSPPLHGGPPPASVCPASLRNLRRTGPALRRTCLCLEFAAAAADARSQFRSLWALRRARDPKAAGRGIGGGRSRDLASCWRGGVCARRRGLGEELLPPELGQDLRSHCYCCRCCLGDLSETQVGDSAGGASSAADIWPQEGAGWTEAGHAWAGTRCRWVSSFLPPSLSLPTQCALSSRLWESSEVLSLKPRRKRRRRSERRSIPENLYTFSARDKEPRCAGGQAVGPPPLTPARPSACRSTPEGPQQLALAVPTLLGAPVLGVAPKMVAAPGRTVLPAPASGR
uniref:uncharacterized protein LOC128928085 n=1 Tax=Callithrix jacchus TaxID=9483 RepID=UPI0023DD1EA9|nr:uncharacterized protein LOC128928085 [Callithrix jacchus]